MEPIQDDSVYQSLINQGYTDEQIQQIMQLAALNKQEEALGRSRAMAGKLRETPLPDGRSNNGVYTAANPLEFAGAVLSQRRGNQAINQIEARNAGLQEEMMKRRMEYLKGGRTPMPTYDPAPPLEGGFV